MWPDIPMDGRERYGEDGENPHGSCTRLCMTHVGFVLERYFAALAVPPSSTKSFAMAFVIMST